MRGTGRRITRKCASPPPCHTGNCAYAVCMLALKAVTALSPIVNLVLPARRRWQRRWRFGMSLPDVKLLVEHVEVAPIGGVVELDFAHERDGHAQRAPDVVGHLWFLALWSLPAALEVEGLKEVLYCLSEFKKMGEKFLINRKSCLCNYNLSYNFKETKLKYNNPIERFDFSFSTRWHKRKSTLKYICIPKIFVDIWKGHRVQGAPTFRGKNGLFIK